jgi:hypothetical protein
MRPQCRFSTNAEFNLVSALETIPAHNALAVGGNFATIRIGNLTLATYGLMLWNTSLSSPILFPILSKYYPQRVCRVLIGWL